METGATPTIRLGGKDLPVVVPISFADREDVSAAWHSAKGSVPKSRRAYGLAVGLCVPGVAKRAGADYEAMDCDGAAFGKAVYDHLRGQGSRGEEIAQAATVCYMRVVDSLYPREPEVAAQADFTGPAEAAPT